MPTKNLPQPTSLFLLAHQDDEFGVFDEIRRAALNGTAICAYFTDGAAGSEPSRRNRESLTVLQRLGVPAEDVRFLGEANGIADGRLFEQLDVVAKALQQLLSSIPDDAMVYLPAWEGGHHDHDGLHAVAALLLHKQGQLGRAKQFALYHAHRCVGPFFRVLQPLKENGTITVQRLQFGNRLRYLRHCLSYPSQAKTWLGLFPFVALAMLLRGRQSMQAVQVERVRQRPHAGKLYYEKRGFLAYETLAQAIATHSNPGTGHEA
ncbi:MAG: LmbE family N-acetylglucosaminyl deacetylase [Planctomycetota bacterium]|jgi:LmbE family N-acetylglucosaminyl deacetylase